MKVVKFKDGTYAIRKGWIFYKYLDLKTVNSFYWNITDRFFADCKGTKEEVCKRYKQPEDKGTIVCCNDPDS